MGQYPDDWQDIGLDDWKDITDEDNDFGSGYAVPKLRDTALLIPKGLKGLADTALGLGDIATSPLQYLGLPSLGDAANYLGYDPKAVSKWIEQFESPELQQAQKEFGAAQGFGDSISALKRNPGLAALGLGEAAPYVAGGAGVARLGLRALPWLGRAGAAMLGEGTMGAGSQAAQIREETGGLTPGQAGISALTGVGNAAITGASGRIARRFGFPDIDEWLLDPKRQGFRKVPTLFGSGITEGLLEEAPQSGMEQASFNYATGKPIGQGVPGAITMGGVLGFGIGGILPALRRNAAPQNTFNRNTSEANLPPHAYNYQQELPFGPFEEQLDLPFGPDPQQHGPDRSPIGPTPGIDPFTGKFRKIPTGEPTQAGFEFSGVGNPPPETLFDMNPPSPPTQPPPPADGGININIGGEPNVVPEGSTLSDDQQTVFISKASKELINYWRSKGYEPAGVDPQTHLPRMVRKGSGVAPPPPPTSGNIAVGQPIPTKNVTPELRTALEGMGWFVDKMDAAWTSFKRGTPTGEKGEVDFTFIAQKLQRLLGRQPTQQEVEREAFKLKADTPPPVGGSSGVADFEPKGLRESISDGDLLNYASYFRDTGENPDLLRQIESVLRTRGINPDTAEVPPIDDGIHRGWNWDTSGDRPPLSEWPVNTTIVNDPQTPLTRERVVQDYENLRRALENPNRGVPVTPHDLEILEQYRRRIDNFPPEAPFTPSGMREITPYNNNPAGLDPRMAGRIEQAGVTEEWDLRRRAPVEQGNLVPMEMREQNQLARIADADLNRIQANDEANLLARTPLSEPEQQSMLPQMSDEEIRQYLMREDATPPEMRDLSEYGDDPLVSNARDTPGRAFRSDPNRPDLGRDRWEERRSKVTNSLADAWTAQYARARELGIDPEPFGRMENGAEALAEAIYNRRQELLNDEPPVSKMEDSEGQLDNLRRMLGREPTQEEFEDYITAPVTKVPPGSAAGAENSWPQKVRGVSEYEAHGMVRNDKAPSHAFRSDRPVSRMQVREGGYGGGGPIIVNPQTGRPNIAMGGADPQVIKQLGQSLYTKDRPSVLIQELFQNTIDEMKISGVQKPVRVAFVNNSTNPVTGDDQKSIVFQDFGRGMNESQLYNEFSDVGKSGKRNIQGAAGGFGFAKAAPFLGGQHMRVESITMEGGEKVRYTFEGNPEEFVAQDTGVPLNREVLDDPYNTNYDKPTGMRVEVFFERDKYFNYAKQLLKLVSENSTGVKEIEAFDSYNSSEDTINPGSFVSKFIKDGEQGLGIYDRANYFNRYESQAQPPLVTTITTPSNDIAVRFELDNVERQSTTLIYLNNGVFYHSRPMGVGLFPLAHIPPRIIFDINTKVQEGHTHYPFPANREGINQQVDRDVISWVNTNVVAPAKALYRAEIQQVYNSLQPVSGNRHVILDSGAKYTPQELAKVEQSPTLRKMGRIMEDLLADLATYFTPAESKGVTGKFGFRIADEGTGGVNIHDPSSTTGATQFAILVNPFDMFRSTFANVTRDLTPAQAARRFVHIVKHEFTHNLVRDEGAGFTWAFSHLDTRFPDTEIYASQVLAAITDATGNYVAEIPDLIRENTAARGRPESQVDILSRQTESPLVARAGQAGVPRGGKPHGKRTPTQQQGTSWLREAMALPTNATTMGDMSAPGRQGLTLILTPEFWKALPRMVGAVSYKHYKIMDDNLKSKPIMLDHIDLKTGKIVPSFAKKIGTKLFTPASEIGPRGEMTASKWLEVGVGNDPLSKLWKHTAGYPIRASNRAYIMFLNHLNVNRTEKLLNLARDMSIKAETTGRGRQPGILGTGGLITKSYTPAEAKKLDPYKNLVLAKEIAEFVNAATGHGSPQNFIERGIHRIGPILFSPGLLISRVRMMNPATYIMASPFVRRQYLKSAISTAAAWYVMTQLMKNGLGDEAEIGDDPTSADFGKIRVGDARLDLGGGFSQFVVAYGRFYAGGSTSSASGQFHRFGSGYQAQTQEDMMERFMVNKLNPAVKFAWDIASATEYNPFHVGDRIIQSFTPLFIQDLHEINKENPELLGPFGAAAFFGGGTQIYSKGESVSKFIDQENDWNVTGGGLRDLMPWNWSGEEQPRNFPWSEPE